MSSAVPQVLVLFVLIYSFVQFSTSLKCYQCSELTNPHCRSPLAPTDIQITECEKPNLCVKHESQPSGKTPAYIHRSCLPDNYCELVKAATLNCTRCNTDYCNV